MESLIGKQIKGFKFSGKPTYVPLMKNFDGVIGTIKYDYKNVVQVEFPNGDIWNYPHKKALNYLVKEELEEELSIEQILNRIKSLTKQI